MDILICHGAETRFRNTKPFIFTREYICDYVLDLIWHDSKFLALQANQEQFDTCVKDSRDSWIIDFLYCCWSRIHCSFLRFNRELMQRSLFVIGPRNLSRIPPGCWVKYDCSNTMQDIKCKMYIKRYAVITKLWSITIL